MQIYDECVYSYIRMPYTQIGFIEFFLSKLTQQF